MKKTSSKYDWDQWFKRRRFVLTQGKDGHFTCGIGAMNQQIRNAAVTRGLKVSIVEGDGQITVVVTGRSSKGRQKCKA